MIDTDCDRSQNITVDPAIFFYEKALDFINGTVQWYCPMVLSNYGLIIAQSDVMMSAVDCGLQPVVCRRSKRIESDSISSFY